jgi:ribonuclease HII
MTPGSPPSLRVERRMLRGGITSLACCDEVGRGSLSGPVSVAMVVVDAETRPAPAGVRDSKLLTASARADLVPLIQGWARAWAVGHASPAEIDEWGIVPAMRLAGHRALADLPRLPDAILLDGSHDYLTPPEQESLFDGPRVLEAVPSVVTLVKADLQCAAVAAASILAKTSRDAIMIDLATRHPRYRWELNKGYAAPEHIEALRDFGPTVHHRRSWRLPGVSPDGA